MFPLTSWFTDLRKTALVAAITVVLSGLIPAWNLIRTMLAVQSTEAIWRWARLPVFVLATLLLTIVPIFYYALYDNKGALRIPKRLRLLALGAAFVYGVIVATTLPQWGESLGAYWAAMVTLDWRTGASTVLTVVQDPRTIGQLSTVLIELSNVAYVLLLVAIFRQESYPLEGDVPASKFLNITTKVTVIALGLVVAGVLLGLVLTPYTFYTLRNYAFQLGRTPRSFGDLFVSQIRTVLLQACLFAAPYIIYGSQRERAGSPPDEQPGPEPLESGA